MTIFEVLNVSTSDPERYEKIVNALGKREVYWCIPFTLKEITKAIKIDPNLNNLSLSRQDFAAGYDTGRDNSQCRYIGSSLTLLMKMKCKVNAFNLATNVCILKTAAKMIVEEREMEGK